MDFERGEAGDVRRGLWWRRLGRRRLGRAGLVLGVLAAFSADAFAQRVWRVNKSLSTGADFTTVQEAVDAASDGDVIQVEASPGPDYAGFVVDGKALHFVGRPQFIGGFGGILLYPGYLGRVRVQNLAASQSATFRGMRFVTTDSLGPALILENCLGPILLESVEVEGYAFGDASEPEHPSLLVSGCQAVHIAAARVGPGATQGLGQRPYRGAHLVRSHVVWSGGWAHGGESVQGFQFGPLTVPGMDGADGLWIEGGRVVLSGVEVRGGAGGKGFVDPTGLCFPSGSGGVGLRAFAGAVVHEEQGAFQGGAGAAVVSPTCPSGNPGAAWVVEGSVLASADDRPRFTRATAPTAFGVSQEVRLAGEPFDAVALFAGTTLAGYPLPQAAGVVAIADPVLVAVLSLGADGQGVWSGGEGLVAPPGAQGLFLYLQGLVLDAQGGIRLSAPSVAFLSPAP